MFPRVREIPTSVVLPPRAIANAVVRRERRDRLAKICSRNWALINYKKRCFEVRETEKSFFQTLISQVCLAFNDVLPVYVLLEILNFTGFEHVTAFKMVDALKKVTLSMRKVKENRPNNNK